MQRLTLDSYDIIELEYAVAVAIKKCDEHLDNDVYVFTKEKMEGLQAKLAEARNNRLIFKSEPKD